MLRRIFHRFLISSKYILRRKNIFIENISMPKVWNAVKCVVAYLFKGTHVHAYPVLLKIDVSPFCHLRCPVCLHAASPAIPGQNIRRDMQMGLPLFKKLIDEIAGKTWVLSLQHLGEPLFNKDLAKMCAYAHKKKLNTFFVSNMSVKLNDVQIEEIIQSGVNWISIALDGFSQETYGKTRVGGSINLVKANIEKFLAIRHKLNMQTPFIEIQSLLFKHNLHEKHKVIQYCKEIHVDKLTFKRGSEKPWIHPPSGKTPVARRRNRLPLCFWPYLSGVILYDGDVVPCCWHRHDNAYAKDKERIKMGSIADNTFMNVYNNDRYRELRMVCTDPRLLEKNKTGGGRYCYGCMRLFS
jgi:MoaA/NifB/PqqE/SkfB family radical SAM enzyme